jgi:aspartate aminotransferase-like enzyme
MTSPPQRSWLPGPVAVHPDVLAAMLRPMPAPRSAEGGALLARVGTGLRQLFRTRRPVVTATTSATGMVEAAIRCGVRERVLCVVAGHAGERAARVAERCDRDVVRLHVPPGEALEPALLAQLLDGPPVDAVILVHAETMTGVQHPIADLLRLVRPMPDVVTIVDASTTLGAADVDPERWGADVVFSSSQRAVGIPPGLAFATISDRFLVRAAEQQDRGLHLDLVPLHEAAIEGHVVETPALPQLMALDVQLQRIAAEGLEARWARHRTMRELVEDWVQRHKRCTMVAPVGRRADAVSALRLGPGRSAAGLVRALHAEGWDIAAADEPTDRVICIGHMGDASPEDLAALLAHLEPRL